MEIKNIKEALNRYLDEHKLSANDFGKRTKINAAYISAIRNEDITIKVGNKIVPIQEKWLNKIADFIGLKSTKELWPFRDTPESYIILKNLEEAKEFGQIRVIIAETGAGKSYVCEKFVKQHPLDAYILKVSFQDSISDLLDNLMDKMGIPYVQVKKAKLKNIINFLYKKKFDGQKPIVIFDEAEYMKMPALCAIKELFDHLHDLCGIVIVGTSQLVNNIEKLRKKNKQGMPQLYRRIKFGIRILPTINRNFKEFLSEIEDKKLKSFLINNCENYGELHDALLPALKEVEQNGGELSENLVREILNMPRNGELHY